MKRFAPWHGVLLLVGVASFFLGRFSTFPGRPDTLSQDVPNDGARIPSVASGHGPKTEGDDRLRSSLGSAERPGDIRPGLPEGWDEYARATDPLTRHEAILRMMEKNPEATLKRMADRLTPALFFESASVAVEAWMDHAENPEEIPRWIRDEVSHPQSKELVRHAFESWAKQRADHDFVASHVLTAEDFEPIEQSRILQGVLQSWTDQDWRQMATWAEGIGSEALGDDVVTQVVYSIAALDPKLASTWNASIRDERQRQENEQHLAFVARTLQGEDVSVPTLPVGKTDGE